MMDEIAQSGQAGLGTGCPARRGEGRGRMGPQVVAVVRESQSRSRTLLRAGGG